MRSAVKVGKRPVFKLKRRKNSGQELKEQLHFHQELIDSLPNPVFYVNADGFYECCNLAYQELVGLPRESIIGKSFYQVHPVDFAHLYEQNNNQLLAKPGVQRREVPCLHANGSLRHLVSTKATYVNSQGRIAGVVGVLTDITERKKAEEALQAEKERLFQLLDGLPLLIALVDENHCLRFGNQYFLDLFGEWQGRHCYEIFEGRQEPCVECHSVRTIKTGQTDYREWTCGGRVFETYNFPFIDSDGTNLALFIGIDISRRKHMENKLRESEERYRKLVDLSPDAIFIHSRDKIEYANQAGLNLVGAAAMSDLNSKTAMDFVHPDSLPEVIKRMETIMTCNDCLLFMEHKIVRLDGKTLEVEVAGVPLIMDGEKYVQIVIRDMTARKEMERQFSRLEALNLVGEMAASIGHEIRNPMTSVRGFLQLLGGKEEFARHKGYFDLMIEELDRANGIISDYLSLARNKVIEKRMHDINDVLDKIKPMIEADALENGMHVEYRQNDVDELYLDEKEMRQLILNLVRNGLQTMDPGGRLNITTCMEQGDVMLAIRDQGSGIAGEVLDKIGTPFVTTKNNGTGLGLAVCYSIAHKHNAVIGFTTGSSGTTFRVRFKQAVQ